MIKSIKFELIGFFFFFLLFCSSSYSDFLFQDNTLMNQLRVCNESKCEVLSDGNSSSLSNISYIYEVGGGKLNLNMWDFINSNILLVLGFLMVIILIFFVIKRTFW